MESGILAGYGCVEEMMFELVKEKEKKRKESKERH